MSEGRLQLQHEQVLEPQTISAERPFTDLQGESATERRGIDLENQRSSPSGVLVEAYERALPTRGGLVPELVLREFCQFLVSL
jgi:hypothetical protein